MVKKHCLFCDEIVPIESAGDYDKYMSCSCSPEGFYSLLRESYESINSLSYQEKRHIFPLISAYIRERTDCDDLVALSFDDMNTIANSPKIPVTIEEKGNRLLQYLYRHSDAAEEPVVIQPLSRSYNLTYSPNLQELVFIIDKLATEQLIIREGMTFRLTTKGWSEAALSAGGRKLKSCCVLISDEAMSSEWLDKVLPKIEQYGYVPQLINLWNINSTEPNFIELVSASKLVIADLTGQEPEVYFAAGYALGREIPVIWTVRGHDADKLKVQTGDIRPLVWENTEELTAILQQRLSN